MAGQTPLLPHDFLEGRNHWMAFVQTALMPHSSARDPFASAGLGTTLEQMQSDVPLSACLTRTRTRTQTRTLTLTLTLTRHPQSCPT